MSKTKRDNTMVEFSVRFFTTDLAVNHNGKKQKAIWETGMAYPVPNATLGVVGMSGQPFACFEDIVPLLKEMLKGEMG